MVRTSGAIFSWANWRTVARKSCSSSESKVSGGADWEARVESDTRLSYALNAWLSSKPRAAELPWERPQGEAHCANAGAGVPDAPKSFGARWIVVRVRESCAPASGRDWPTGQPDQV